MKLQLLTFKKAILKRSLIAALLIFQALAYGQVNFTDSNLPIVIITTDNNAEIPDDPKVPASMKIIYHTDGSRNYMADIDNAAYINYSGRIQIELRGSTSQDLPKKQYGWTTYEDNGTTKKKVSIMGMPKQNDWILNGLAYDASLMRDYLSYNTSRGIGYYTVRTQYCEMVLNGTYKGLYILQEKLKDDPNRINIEAIADDASTGAALTGGYITKADKTTGGDPVAWTMDSYHETTDFIHELPKPEEVTPAQNDYIHGQFTSLETAAHNNNADPGTGYPSIIDIPTFVDFIIMNEMASNVDGYQISTFFHKDKGGKLRAGPIWDFNLTFGHDQFGTRSKTDVWQFDNNDNDGAKFWKDLFNQSSFKCYVSRRWNEVTASGQPLSYNYMSAFLDETATLISEAAVRENKAWGTVPNLANEVANIKSFIAKRITWINSNVGSFSDCAAVTVPQLVISQINYNPATTTEFPKSDDQEFIEITNAGKTTVNLTGIYLIELGLSYQFPAGATLEAGKKVHIASNPDVFKAKYGVEAFGQYQRNLSNSTQNIVLADAFGNIIDHVEYLDTTPWPADADGNGSYLTLKSVTLDNALASSWIAVADDKLSDENIQSAANIAVYPNPVGDILFIRATGIIKNVQVYDIYGKLLQSVKPNYTALDVDFSQYASGVYFVKIAGSNGAVTQKIVRQ